MKQLSFVLTMVLVITVGGAVESREVFASNVHWTSPSGSVWKNASGECWSSSFSSGDATPDCGGVMMKKMEKMEKMEETTMAAAPDLDIDGDGVPNSDDICWTTPVGVKVDVYGCKAVVSEIMVSLQGVHFASDSAALTSQAKSILDSSLAAINANSGSQLSIEGHADSRMSDSYNQALSQRRAQSVVDYLMSHGVSSSRLNPIGMGEGNPVASNDTKEGRAQNRRVEIIVN